MDEEDGTLDDGGSNGRHRYDVLLETLRKTLTDFAEEHDVSPKLLALLLVDLAVASWSLDYVLRTAKPSGLGLKRELDRFQREIDDFIRSDKKEADAKISGVRKFMSSIECQESPDMESAA